MKRRLLVGLGSLVALLLASTPVLAAEEGAKKPKDAYRSVVAKLNAARQKAIKADPKLKEAYDALRTKRLELEKELQDLYKKVDATNPEAAALAKEKAALDAEREKKREADRAARKPKKPKREPKEPKK